MKKLLIFIVVVMILIAPTVSFAAPLVDCGLTTGPGAINKTCGFADFLKMVNKVINFILYVMVIPIAAIMFAYAGFLLVTSGGSTEKWGKAKSIFGEVFLGLVIAAACWLIVKVILSIAGYNGAWIGFS